MTVKNNGGVVEIDGERYASKTFDYQGESLTIRELSADETDEATEGSKGPDGKYNAALQTRLLLAKALVPPVDVTRVGKFGNLKFQTVVRHFNDLNSLPAPKDGELPTTPAG